MPLRSLHDLDETQSLAECKQLLAKQLADACDKHGFRMAMSVEIEDRFYANTFGPRDNLPSDFVEFMIACGEGGLTKHATPSMRQVLLEEAMKDRDAYYAKLQECRAALQAAESKLERWPDGDHE